MPPPTWSAKRRGGDWDERHAESLRDRGPGPGARGGGLHPSGPAPAGTAGPAPGGLPAHPGDGPQRRRQEPAHAPGPRPAGQQLGAAALGGANAPPGDGLPASGDAQALGPRQPDLRAGGQRDPAAPASATGSRGPGTFRPRRPGEATGPGTLRRRAAAPGPRPGLVDAPRGAVPRRAPLGPGPSGNQGGGGWGAGVPRGGTANRNKKPRPPPGKAPGGCRAVPHPRPTGQQYRPPNLFTAPASR